MLGGSTGKTVKRVIARRTALTGLAAQLPAAVLADLLHLRPTTAVRWVHNAGGEWNRYAAQLINTRDDQP